MNEGLVGALKFGVYLTDDNNNYILDSSGNRTVHHIATVSGISNELRNLISNKDMLGQVTLTSSIYGQVASIDGQDISSKNFRFSHAIYKGWRYDKTKETCKFKKSLLTKLVM